MAGYTGEHALTEQGSDQAAVAIEVQQIRGVFFELFVESLVLTIRGEKLIWMLETSPTGQKLYELDLVQRKARGGVVAAEVEDDDGRKEEEEEENDSD